MTDALTDILRSVRMRGSVFSRAALSAPYGVESGEMSTGIFHAVVRGHPWVQLANAQERIELEPGDIVMFPFGDNHLITDAPGGAHQSIGLLTSVDERGMGHLVVDGEGASTSLICGTVMFEAGDVHPVFSMLPPMICVQNRDRRTSGVVETLIDMIVAEVDDPVPGSEIVVARLTDVLIVTVLRAYINGLEPGEGGWLGALNDPAVREAIGAIHRKPGYPWTAMELAHTAGLSRSAFFARFRETVGEAPAEYLTRWRIHLATKLLREENLSVGATGRQVGYGTEAAFSNAFLRVMGIRPGAYRRAA